MLFSTDLKGRVSYSYNFVYVGSGGVDLTLQSTALKLQNHFEAKFDGMFRGWFSFRIMFVDPSCPLLLLLKKMCVSQTLAGSGLWKICPFVCLKPWLCQTCEKSAPLCASNLGCVRLVKSLPFCVPQTVALSAPNIQCFSPTMGTVSNEIVYKN